MCSVFGLVGWKPGLTRYPIPGIPPSPPPPLSPHPTDSINDPRQLPPYQTNTGRVVFGYWFGRAKPWALLELPILAPHHVHPHFNISLHTPYTPPAMNV